MTALSPDRAAASDHRYYVSMWARLDPECVAAREYKAMYEAIETKRPELEAQRIEIMAGRVRRIGEKV